MCKNLLVVLAAVTVACLFGSSAMAQCACASGGAAVVPAPVAAPVYTDYYSAQPYVSYYAAPVYSTYYTPVVRPYVGYYNWPGYGYYVTRRPYYVGRPVLYAPAW